MSHYVYVIVKTVRDDDDDECFKQFRDCLVTVAGRLFREFSSNYKSPTTNADLVKCFCPDKFNS